MILIVVMTVVKMMMITMMITTNENVARINELGSSKNRKVMNKLRTARARTVNCFRWKLDDRTICTVGTG